MTGTLAAALLFAASLAARAAEPSPLLDRIILSSAEEVGPAGLQEQEQAPLYGSVALADRLSPKLLSVPPDPSAGPASPAGGRIAGTFVPAPGPRRSAPRLRERVVASLVPFAIGLIRLTLLQPG